MEAQATKNLFHGTRWCPPTSSNEQYQRVRSNENKLNSQSKAFKLHIASAFVNTRPLKSTYFMSTTIIPQAKLNHHN